MIIDTTQRVGPRPRKPYSYVRRALREILAERFGPWCVWCGAQFSEANPETLEHLVPRALGGSYVVENLALACDRCNKARGARFSRSAACSQ